MTLDAELRELLHERAATATFEPLDPGSIISLAQTKHRRRQQTRAGALLAGLVTAAVVTVLVVEAPKSERPASLIPATIAPQLTPSARVTPTLLAPSFAPLPKGWIAAPPGPLPVQDATGTRVGSKIVYWGGGDNGVGALPSYSTKGAVFDVTRRRWAAMAPSPLSGRTTMATAGSDGVYFVWGGYATGLGYFDDGALYDVVANSWKQVAPGPLGAQATVGAVWTGSEFVVVSGPGPHSGSAAAYNPATDSWRRLPDLPTTPASASLLLVSGRIVVFGAGASYVLSPDGASWSLIASPVNIDPATLTFASEGDYAYAVGTVASRPAPTPQPLSLQRFSFAAGSWDVRPSPPLPEVECYPTLAMSTKQVFLGYCGGNAVFNRAGQYWSSTSEAGKGRPVAIGSELVFYYPGADRTLIYTGP
jgi:hypothetical protein